MYRRRPTLHRLLLTTGLAASLATVFAAGCATTPGTQARCASADWHAVGQADGERGLGLSQLEQHQADCTDAPGASAIQAYLEGRADGLEQYCTMGNGMQVGRDGGGYSGACPGGSEYYFLTGFRMGHEIHRLDREMASNRRKVDRLEASLTTAGADRQAARAELATLNAEFERMSERVSVLEAETRRVIVRSVQVLPAEPD